jgi:plasmid stabilization system protein ParE
MLAIKDFENYLLFYLEHEDCVDVIRVLHGAHDIPEALHS